MHRPALAAGLGLLAASTGALAAPNPGNDDGQLEASSAEPAIIIPVLDDGGADRIFWKGNLRFESGDGQTKVQIGGRIQYDANWLSADDEIPNQFEEDEIGFRRVRLALAGTIYGNIGYKVQYDFAGRSRGDDDGNNVGFRDVYGTINNFLIGELRVGQFWEPFGLEAQTSSNNITFLEKALTNSLTPDRHVGAMVSDYVADDHFGWAVGVFGAKAFEDGDNDTAVEGNYSATGRVFWAPVMNEAGDEVVHVGAALSQRAIAEDDLEVSSDEFSLLGSPFTLEDTDADGDFRFGLEAAWVNGPLSLQSEYISVALDGPGSQPDLMSYYLQASYFLTEDHRVYDRGTFGAVKPSSPWRGFDSDGTGAWELAARYSFLDYDTPQNDEVAGLTAGVNWYLNAGTRISANYTVQQYDGTVDGDVDGFELRFQFVF
jgi:phosphate-selective porin OprO/OprP